MRSTIDIDPECMTDIISMLGQFGVKVIGSKDAERVVCLTIEGDIVPDLPKVMIRVDKAIGTTIATLTALCQAADPD